MLKKTKIKHNQNWFHRFRCFMAIEFDNVSNAEKLVATLGGVIGIVLISYISYQISGQAGAALIVPSMGASAVLVFAYPTVSYLSPGH